MELIIAFIFKFIGVIYGAIYGLISSVPFIKEWIAISKIDIVIRGGALGMVNTGHNILVVIDGQAVWDGGTTPVPRLLLHHGQDMQIVAHPTGEVRVWLKIVDIATGKELTVTKRLLA
ncbi:MAG: hypothetical protein AABY83_03840 [Pseudomonadota bacterium]